MHQLVQNAIEAAKCGDKNRAQGYLKQVLTANSNDVDGWLVLAAVLDDPEKKRQCLNRVLTIDPVNKFARQQLLEMDRAAFREMSAPAPQPVVVETPKFRPEPAQAVQPVQSVQSVQPSFPQTPPVTVFPVVQPQPGTGLSKTLVFTYPLWMKILTYLVSGVFWVAAIGALCASPSVGLVFMAVAFGSLISIWIISARVEVSNEGIMTSRLLMGGSKIAWNEIAEFKSGLTGQNLDLISKSGKKVSVTAQVGGYSEIIDVLRRKRPDLFNGQPGSQAGATPERSLFTGEKTFKRNVATSVVSYGIGLIAILFGMWGIFSNLGKASSNWIAVIFFTIFGLFIIGANLLAVQELVIRPQRITLIKNFGEEQLTQNQISEIKIKTVRGRGGRVSHFVVIQRASGGSISMNGLGGTEIIYGTLMNWWQSAS